MTPAEELRAAAFKLREASDETSTPPWKIAVRYSRKHPTVMAGAEFITGDRSKGVSLKYSYCLPDAKWNALTHPGLAEPLAMLLDDQAAMYEGFLPRGEDIAERVVWWGLGVARQINGGVS